MSTRVRSARVESPSLVRWGAVFSGTVVGVAFAFLAGSLWAALAFASHRSLFYNHLAWWFAGTAIGATFIAALIAGLVSATRGAVSGLANGVTTWGLVVIATIAGGTPGLVAYGSTRPIVINGIRVAVTTVRPWTTFWALLIGLGAALLGGVFGGTMRRPATEPTEEQTVDVRDQQPVPVPVAVPMAQPAPVAVPTAQPATVGAPPVAQAAPPPTPPAPPPAQPAPPAAEPAPPAAQPAPTAMQPPPSSPRVEQPPWSTSGAPPTDINEPTRQ